MGDLERLWRGPVAVVLPGRCQRTACPALFSAPREGTRVLSRLQPPIGPFSVLFVFPFCGLSYSEACFCNSWSSSVFYLGAVEVVSMRPW